MKLDFLKERFPDLDIVLSGENGYEYAQVRFGNELSLENIHKYIRISCDSNEFTVGCANWHTHAESEDDVCRYVADLTSSKAALISFYWEKNYFLAGGIIETENFDPFDSEYMKSNFLSYQNPDSLLAVSFRVFAWDEKYNIHGRFAKDEQGGIIIVSDTPTEGFTVGTAYYG